MVSDRALWQAINAHDLDKADAVRPFSRRLMRETGWTPTFTRRAILEYKAFIYLVCVSGTMLSPSNAVDEVWHLHLIYTRDYWDRFCGGVLKRPIHHSPSDGGAAKDALYRGAYERTRRLYLAEFGAPPPDLWPEADWPCPAGGPPKTASRDIHLPKRQVFLCLAGAGLALLAGCTPQGLNGLWNTHRLLGLGAIALAWWLWLTVSGYRAIAGKGLGGYVAGGVFAIPLVALWSGVILMSIVRQTDYDGGNGYIWLLAVMIGMAVWRTLYVSKGPKGDGSGSGSGCGSGCGGGGSDGGGHGCGGHGCGSSCGGGCGGH